MPLWAGAALGGCWLVGVILVVPWWCSRRAVLNREIARLEELIERHERLVGFCSECGGPVVLSRSRSVASCPSGCSAIPGAFFLTARGHG
jgi:hypothetical protein